MVSGPQVLGVDGGGSKTHAVLVDAQGRRLGSGISGAANHQIVGVEAAVAHVRQACDQALAEAGVETSAVDFVQFSLAGLDRPHDFAVVGPGLGRLGYRAWDQGVDTWSGLRAGTTDHVGVVLICGNGTNAAGRNRAGETLQVGGVGVLYGDATGATVLATDLFRAAFRSWEGRAPASVLPQKLLEYFGFATMEALRDDFLDRNVTQIREPALAKKLHEAADEGDGLAREILAAAGRELALAGNTVVRRLGDFGPGPLRVVLVGGVLQQGRHPALIGALEQAMRDQHPDVEFVVPSLAPVYGAILMGFDRLGLAASSSLHERFISYGGYER